MRGLRKRANSHALCLGVGGAKAGQGGGSRSAGEHRARHSLRGGDSLRCERGVERARFLHTRKTIVGTDNLFITAFVKVSWVRRRQGSGTRKACSAHFQLKVMDPDFHM